MAKKTDISASPILSKERINKRLQIFFYVVHYQNSQE